MHPDRPWLTALEMQFAALRLARERQHDMTRASASRTICSVAAERLAQAEAYAWAAAPTRAVAAAALTLPGSTRLGMDLAPSAVAWWWFEEPVQLVPVPGMVAPDAPVRALLVTLTDRDPEFHRASVSFIAFTFLEDGSAPVPCTAWITEVDSDIQAVDEMAGEARRTGHPEVAAHAGPLTRFAAAGGYWLKQRLLVVGSGAIERHHRKQLAREHGVPLPAEVKVVSLRALESSTVRGPLDEPHDWSCRWVVRGHWRMQPYKDRVEPVFIMPHVKGPADKPLRVPAQTVFSVHR